MPQPSQASPPSARRVASRPRRRAMLAGIVLLAAVLRLWGIGFGLPYLYHPDEPNKIHASLGIFKSGDLNPHYFLKPGFIVYLNAAAHWPYYLHGRIVGRFAVRDDIPLPVMLTMGVGRTATPGAFLIGRLLTAAFSMATVFLAFVAARRLTRSSAAGLAAALFLAVSPGHVEQAHYITPDTYAVFFGLAAMIASLGIARRGAMRDYLLAGAAVGLAAAAKYNGAAYLAIPVAAHFLGHRGATELKARHWVYLIAGVVFAFIALNPYAILSAREFVGALRSETHHYASGHVGMEGGSALWYLRRFAFWEGPVLLVALWQVARARRRRRAWFVALFPLLYLAVVCFLPVRNARTALPALPFFFVFAAWGLAPVCRLMARSGRRRLLAAIGLAALVALPLGRSIAFDLALATPDSRLSAARWLARNVPPGSRVAVEGYSAFVDPRRCEVLPVVSIPEYSMEEYRTHGFRYFVFGQEIFDRYLAHPERYPERAAAYRRFFDTLPVARVFQDGGYEVRVHRSPDAWRQGPAYSNATTW